MFTEKASKQIYLKTWLQAQNISSVNIFRAESKIGLSTVEQESQ